MFRAQCPHLLVDPVSSRPWSWGGGPERCQALYGVLDTQTQCNSGRVYDAGRAQMASPCGFSGLRNRYLVKLIQTLSCWPPLSGHPTSQHPCPPPLEGDLGSPLAHDCNLHRLLCYSPWLGSGSNCLYSLRHTNDCPSLSPPELWGSEYDSQGPAANHCPPPTLYSALASGHRT